MWYSYNYSYQSDFDWDVFWSVFTGIMCVVGIVCLVFYIFQSLGIYTIAKRRQVANAWAAWVPVLNVYLLGKISDQYQGYAQGRKTNRAATLLWCSIITFIIMIPYILVLVNMISQMSGWIYESYSWGGSSYRWSQEPPMGTVIALVVMSLLVMVVAMIAMVFQYIALYDLFRSCEPKNATVFLVISIFFNVAMPFLVFAMRNKDAGMLTPAQQQQRWQQEQACYAQQWQAQQAWQAQQWQAQQQQWQAQQVQPWQPQQQQQWQPQQQQQQWNDPTRQ